MGPEFAGTSANILVILLLGFVFNSLAQVPFASIQSRGYAKITAYIHMVELIPYLMALFYFINNYGIIGAAYAWSIRVTIDYILLAFFDRCFDK